MLVPPPPQMVRAFLPNTAFALAQEGDGAGVQRLQGRLAGRLRRQALHGCCGSTEAAAKGFGTRSLRRGDDTILFGAGVDAVTQWLLGMWTAETVGLGYIGSAARQQVRWAQAATRV